MADHLAELRIVLVKLLLFSIRQKLFACGKDVFLAQISDLADAVVFKALIS